MTDPNNPGRAGGAALGTSDRTSDLDSTSQQYAGTHPPQAVSSDWSATTRAQVETGNRPGGDTTSSLPVAGQPAPAAPAKKPKRGLRQPTPSNAVDQYAAAMAAGAPPAPGAPPVAAAPVGASAPRKVARSRPERAPRRARLQLRHLNVWSVLKFSCVLAVALFFVWLIMIGVLYGILDVLGVFGKVNDTYRTINGDDNAKDIVSSNLVLGGAFVIGLVNIVLFILLSTIGSIVYNLCADLVGGIEVTLAERDT